MVKADLMGFDAFVPEFHRGIEVVELNGAVQYLHDKRGNNYLRIASNELEIIEDIFKKIPLINIIEKRMLKNNQTGVSDVLRVISKLKEAGFLKKDRKISYSVALQTDSNFAKDQRFLMQGLNVFKGINVLKLKSAPLVAGNLQNFSFFSSNFFVLFFGVISLTGFAGAGTFLNDFRLFYGSQGFWSIVSYYFAIISAWFFVNIVLSLKNLITAIQFSSLKIEIKNHGIKFVCGFLFYWIDTRIAIKAKQQDLIKIFLTRIFTPLLVSGVSFVAYRFYLQSDSLLLLSCVAFFVFLFSISPLFKSDFSTLFCFATKTGENLAIANLFNKKSFTRVVFNWRNRMLKKKRFILYALFSFVWVIAATLFLTSILGNEVSFIWQQIIATEIFFDKFFVGIVLLIVLMPPAFALLVIVAILVKNIQNYVSKPFATVMNRFSAQFRDKDMPSAGDFKNFISHIPILSQISQDEVKMLYSKIKVKRYSQNTNILNQGEKGDFFYLIYYGKVAVCIESSKGDYVQTDVLKTGDVFGEIALSINVPRVATVKALATTMTFALDKDSFNEYIVKKLGNGADITQLIRVSKMLLNNDVFSCLSSKQIFGLYQAMRKVIYKEGQTIFSQDEQGDCMFIIYDGKVEIERKEEGKTGFKKILKKGNIFGEISLLKGIPRTATASAASDCCLYALQKDDLFCLINFNIAFAIGIDGLAHERFYEFGGLQ